MLLDKKSFRTGSKQHFALGQTDYRLEAEQLIWTTSLQLLKHIKDILTHQKHVILKYKGEIIFIHSLVKSILI